MSNLWVTNLQDQKMIDKYIIKFCETIDNITDWIANKLAGPRCKCGKKKK